MADLLGVDFVDTSSVTKGFDAMTYYLTMGGLILLCLVALGLLWWYFTFKIRIRIRQQTSGGYYVFDTWARQYKQRKTGIIKWRFLKPAQHVAPPPEGYIEITRKGRFSAECDRSVDGTVVWRRISKNPAEVDVFTAEERTMIIHELREAESYKKKNWSQVLVDMAPLLAIVMILTIFMLFFNQAVQPTIDLATSLKGSTESLERASNSLEAACLDRPRLEGVQPGTTTGGVPN